jgi:glycosyltransferase involved in cell wall biosynthesis
MQGAHMAKVDIVVPCYNYGRFLETCVRSVLEQSVGDIRVLIIDDASADHSLSVATKLAEDDERVNVRAHDLNRGHIDTYNEGIDWASADYFLLLSADDMLVPGAIERAAAVMDANQDIVLTHGRCIGWRDELPFPNIEIQQSNGWSRQDLIIDMCEYGGNLVRTPTAIVRTSTQKSIGGYHASLPHSADMEMWLRFAAHGAIARIDAVQAIYRQHSCNMSVAYYDRDLPDLQQRKRAFASFFDEYDWLPERQRLRDLAIRMLAERAFWNGVMQMCRGRIDGGRLLLSFAFDLNPNLRVHPPLNRGPAIFWEVAGRLFGRGRRALASMGSGCSENGGA